MNTYTWRVLSVTKQAEYEAFFISTGLMLYLDVLQVDASKLVLGVPWYGYDYPCTKLYSVRSVHTVFGTLSKLILIK